MDYNTSNLFFQNLIQSIAENKLIAAVIWIAFMIFILRKIAKNYNKDKIIVMNMCGRGDKDIFTIAEELKIKI